jgi:ankyrin repeat protein
MNSNASFQGHWRLCKLLLEHGADVNDQSTETKETPLHAAICNTDRTTYDPELQVLLAHGANPNLATAADVVTEGFMRDCRTKGETALHRAAAFGEQGTIKLLLDAGAQLDARDAYQDTPLSWASWYLRPAGILSLLCYGEFRVNPADG